MSQSTPPKLLGFAVAAALIAIPVTASGWSSVASQTHANLMELEAAMIIYHQKFGTYPDPRGGWWEEVQSGAGVTLSSGALDFWGNPLTYNYPGEHGDFDLYSFGQNGLDDHGLLDDISNWDGVNDGFYWKAAWPRGRAALVIGSVLGIAALLLRIALPWTVTLPIASSAFCLGILLGCHWLMHPGIVPSRNLPLAIGRILASVALATSIVYLVAGVRERRRTS